MRPLMFIAFVLVCSILLPPQCLAGACEDYAAGLPDSFSSTPPGATTIRIDGSIAYVGVMVSGSPAAGELRLYDISNPTSPSLSSTVTYTGSEGGWPMDVQVVGTVAYVALHGTGLSGSGGGFSTVDVSNPLAPVKLGFVSPNTMFYSVLVDGNTAYLTDIPECCGGSLSVFDVTSASTPTFSTSIAATAIDAALKDDVLYVPAFGSLTYYDVSTPGSPVLIDAVTNVDWEFQHVRIVGDILFVTVWDLTTSSETRLVAYDVTIASAPNEIGSLVVGGGGPSALGVFNDVAYIARGASELAIVAVDDATDLSLYATVTLPAIGHEIDADGSALWIAGGSAFTAYPLQCAPIVGVPAGGTSLRPPSVFAAAPFRRGGDIVVEATAGEASLRLFDARGRVIRTLFVGTLSGESRSFRWDGRDARNRPMGAGVYFVRLATTSGTSSTRLVVVD